VPVLFGFILGVIVTIAGAYTYDAQTGRATNGLTSAAASGQAPVVNWGVVGNHWTHLQDDVRLKTEDLEKTLKRHVG
jgi:hypothetical protein